MGSGTVGFQGFGNRRALELPDGRAAAVSQIGRGTIRYNGATNQFEGSRSGASYEAFATGGGGTTVQTLAALSALDDGSLAEGANVAVASVRDVFELDKSSTLTVDGITVVATSSGTGRWLRREFPSLAWANQATWHVNATTGDDENGGDTAGTALATWGEYARRVGDLTIPVAQTVNIDSDLDEGRYQIRGFHPLGLTITGALTQDSTGTIDSVQNWSLAVTPVVDGRITEAGVDFTTLEARLLRLLDGAGAGNLAWVLLGDPAGVGTDTARMSQWFDPTTFSTTNPSGGDSYEVLSQPLVEGSFDVETRDSPGNGVVFIENLNIRAAAGLPGAAFVGGQGGVSVTLCRIDSEASSGASFAGNTLDLSNCIVTSRWGLLGAQSTVVHSCAYDGVFRVLGTADVQFFGICPAQIVAGGDFVGADALVVGPNGIASAVGGGFGACDIGAADQAAVFVDMDAQASIIANSGRFWSLDQGSGTWGMRVEGYGVTHWPTGLTAPTFYRFDDAVAGAEEFEIGGVTTDAAALGGAGTITAANNAAAIPRAT